MDYYRKGKCKFLQEKFNNKARILLRHL